MVKVELYIVTTNIREYDRKALEIVKQKLCEKFGGLTIIPNCEGLWIDNGKIVSDKVELWIILSSSVINLDEIKYTTRMLKSICSQKSQLFTVNGQPYFV